MQSPARPASDLWTDQDPGTDQDRGFMVRALALAEGATGFASPNPMVGCVLVKDGVALGEGTHLYEARDHAEIAALKQALAAGHALTGATAYVTLEPCAHHGRTGPCAEALAAAGIARCVVATVDPNPLVAGRGIVHLREAGVTVEIGLCEQQARALNQGFALSITQSRPAITLKAALSCDGRLAPSPFARVRGEPFWLTGMAARSEVQRMRHSSDAILTGIGTVLADNPLLTDRTGMPRRRRLQRIVLDTHLRLPLDSALVRTVLPHPEPVAEGPRSDLWVFCGPGNYASSTGPSSLEALGATVTPLPLDPTNGRLDLREAMRCLHRATLLTVLLEAGTNLNGAFLDLELVDRVALFYAETELGPDSLPFAPPPLTPALLEERLSRREKHSFGRDVCVTGLLRDPWSAVPGTRADVELL